MSFFIPNLCPCCKTRPKVASSGYCNICNRAKVAERYRKSRAGKTKGLGWRGIQFGAAVKS